MFIFLLALFLFLFSSFFDIPSYWYLHQQRPFGRLYYHHLFLILACLLMQINLFPFKTYRNLGYKHFFLNQFLHQKHYKLSPTVLKKCLHVSYKLALLTLTGFHFTVFLFSLMKIIFPVLSLSNIKISYLWLLFLFASIRFPVTNDLGIVNPISE